MKDHFKLSNWWWLLIKMNINFNLLSVIFISYLQRAMPEKLAFFFFFLKILNSQFRHGCALFKVNKWINWWESCIFVCQFSLHYYISWFNSNMYLISPFLQCLSYYYFAILKNRIKIICFIELYLNNFYPILDLYS